MILQDGRIAVADDEHNVLHVYPAGGGDSEERDLQAFLTLPEGKGEADLEGAARVGDRIYWIGSHGRNKNGKPRPERQVLFATSADGSLVTVGAPARTLLQALLAQARERDPAGRLTPVAEAIARLDFDALAAKPIAPEAGGINVEALAAGPAESLLIGFRSPRAGAAGGPVGAAALVMPLLNPAAVVAGGAPRYGAPVSLDLGGLGLRDMVLRADGTYAIVAGPTDDGSRFAIYSWSGREADTPRRIAADLNGLRPEAIVERGGGLLLLSDDGDDTCKASAVPSFRGRALP